MGWGFTPAVRAHTETRAHKAALRAAAFPSALRVPLSRQLHKAGPGRNEGWRATTKAEDKVILKAFHKVRPPGAGVVARKVRAALPKKLQKKVRERTIIRRLAEFGFTPEKKLDRSTQAVKNAKVRTKFAKKHQDKTPQEWKRQLQGVADVKEFTWYPADLRPRMMQLRASWTYMSKKERTQQAFLRPKRWFKKKEWERVRKLKVFGLVTSNGKVFATACPMPMTGDHFADLVRQKLKPFMKNAFPRRASSQILLDGDKTFRTAHAKAALQESGITVLPNWPPHSPDLNPQENVWPSAENKLRESETKNESFDAFSKRCVKAVQAYPNGQNLITSMAKRMEMCVAAEGKMIGK